MKQKVFIQNQRIAVQDGIESLGNNSNSVPTRERKGLLKVKMRGLHYEGF